MFCQIFTTFKLSIIHLHILAGAYKNDFLGMSFIYIGRYSSVKAFPLGLLPLKHILQNLMPLIEMFDYMSSDSWPRGKASIN